MGPRSKVVLAIMIIAIAVYAGVYFSGIGNCCDLG
jgi:hypothetical protein